ncbi:MAG: glycosyltransferase [Novosphingobium sp.]
MKISYLVHDLNDAAVRRRVALLEGAGMTVRLGGFHRDAKIPECLGKVPVSPLGRTNDGALLQRIFTILRHAVWPGRLRKLTKGADVILARNLETLVLAARVRRKEQRLVYECLDIHRLLLGSGAPSRLLHRLEDWALRDVDLVVVSAPAFRDKYFRQHIGYEGDILLVENLVPQPPEGMPAIIDPQPPLPWVIGWFGMLRCRKGFEMLKAIAANSGGRIEVLIAGRPSPDVFPDFPGEVNEAPGVRFEGAYTAEDLPGLFGRIHFIWAVDYFEEGLNSVWLLPNRLYESIAHGAVPIALESVATGEWLKAQDAGLLMNDPEAELPERVLQMTPEQYRELRAGVARVPRPAVTMNDAEAQIIAHAIAGDV